jgi:cephalosporin hydroxylase
MGNVFIQWLIVKARRLKKAVADRAVDRDAIDSFHKLYYDSMGQTWMNTFWLGVPVQKCPLDLWVYQEIIFELKPDVIIECGTYKGGSALFMAHLLDIVNKGKVISIDLEDIEGRPQHKRIDYLLGSSTSEDVVAQVARLISDKERVMVILDSDHHMEHVLNELRIYSRFVTRGSYLIVEDTNVNGHPVFPTFGPGPMEAVDQFLRENKDFFIDKAKEKFYVTFNPRGYLAKAR